MIWIVEEKVLPTNSWGAVTFVQSVFRATCLATPSRQKFSHCETSGFTGVTLANVSCNGSRFQWSHEIKGTFSLTRAVNRCVTGCRTDVTLRNAWKKKKESLQRCEKYNLILLCVTVSYLAISQRKLHEKVYSSTAPLDVHVFTQKLLTIICTLFCLLFLFLGWQTLDCRSQVVCQFGFSF